MFSVIGLEDKKASHLKTVGKTKFMRPNKEQPKWCFGVRKREHRHWRKSPVRQRGLPEQRKLITLIYWCVQEKKHFKRPSKKKYFSSTPLGALPRRGQSSRSELRQREAGAPAAKKIHKRAKLLFSISIKKRSESHFMKACQRPG